MTSMIQCRCGERLNSDGKTCASYEFSKLHPRIKQQDLGRRGFTLIELLIVIAIIAILAAILMPVLEKAEIKAQGAFCMNNSRQVMLGWRLYAEENNDLLAPNDFYSGDAVPYAPYFGPVKGQLNWVGGTMEYDSSVPDLDATNTQMLTSWAALGTYNPNPATYHCPADHSQLPNVPSPRVRSYSMNSAVGTIWNTATTTAPKGTAVGSTWLTGNWVGGAPNKSVWQTYAKLGSILNPGPSDLWVILDENPWSINDPVFCVGMGPTSSGGYSQFVDTPGSYHNGACGIAFADGHSEIHRWLGGTVKSINSYTTAHSYNAGDSLVDLNWLQRRTTGLHP
jgi:prepilin-type N-terminal cleavage/methylation domain-containing protein/prepilin-type processing-associated H-X9-DG protein